MGSCTSNQNVKESAKKHMQESPNTAGQPKPMMVTQEQATSPPLKIISNTEDLSNFPEFFYLDRQKASLYYITKSQTTEFLLKSHFNLPLDSALTILPNGLVISVGGLIKQSLVKLVYTVDLQTKVVSELPELPIACKLGQLHALGDYIYYIGGVKNGKSDMEQAPMMRFNYRLSLWEDLWRYGEQFQFDRIVNMGTCAFGNKILLIGGQRITSTGNLRNNKKIYSIAVEEDFKVKLESKIPFKVLRPSIANGRKNAVVAGGTNPKTGTPSRGSFLIITQGDGLKIVKFADLSFDLKENYPAIYEQDTAIFISRPFIAVRVKKINNWIGFEISGKESRKVLNFGHEKRPEDPSSDESVAIENASKQNIRGERQVSNEVVVRYSSVYSESPRKNVGSALNTERKIEDLNENNEKVLNDFPNISEIKKYASESNSEYSDDTEKFRENQEVPKFVPVQMQDSNVNLSNLELRLKTNESCMDDPKLPDKQVKLVFKELSSKSSKSSGSSSSQSKSPRGSKNLKSKKSSKSSKSKKSSSSSSSSKSSNSSISSFDPQNMKYEPHPDVDYFNQLSPKDELKVASKRSSESDIEIIVGGNNIPIPSLELLSAEKASFPSQNIPINPIPFFQPPAPVGAKSLKPNQAPLEHPEFAESKKLLKSSSSSQSESSKSKSSKKVSKNSSLSSISSNMQKPSIKYSEPALINPKPDVPILKFPVKKNKHNESLSSKSKSKNPKTITISSSDSDSGSGSSITSDNNDIDIFTSPIKKIEVQKPDLMTIEEQVFAKPVSHTDIIEESPETEVNIEILTLSSPIQESEFNQLKPESPNLKFEMKPVEFDLIFDLPQAKPVSDPKSNLIPSLKNPKPLEKSKSSQGFVSIDVSKAKPSTPLLKTVQFQEPLPPRLPSFSFPKKPKPLGVISVKNLVPIKSPNLFKSPSEENIKFNTFKSSSPVKSQDFGQVYSKTISSRSNLVRNIQVPSGSGRKNEKGKFKSQYFFSEDNMQKLVDIIATEFEVNRVYCGLIRTANEFQDFVYKMVDGKVIEYKNLFNLFSGITLIFGKKEFSDKQVGGILRRSEIGNIKEKIDGHCFALAVYKGYKTALLKKR